MSEAITCTAVFRGKEYTLSISGFSRLSKLSHRFLSRMMAEAKEKGMQTVDKQMEYALAQVPGERLRKNSTGPKTNKAHTVKREERAQGKHENLLNGFLLGRLA